MMDGVPTRHNAPMSCPEVPKFEIRPAEVVDYLVARILDHLPVTHRLMPPWGQG